MKQRISVITIGIADLSAHTSFLHVGLRLGACFREYEEIIFYQMNGFVLGTFLKASLETII